MTPFRSLRAIALHTSLNLRLNVRNRQALIYGYVVPVIFLLAFSGIFRGGQPLLWHEMPQLLTISILGGAALGLPTTLVSERERGVWRRYQLLPCRPLVLLTGTLLARVLIVASSAGLQLALARFVFGTPMPLHAGAAALAFLSVTFAFVGIGLVIAAVANDVPAVQALGQCVFLPMIMIGGVGVPLAALPEWAQRVAGFMPGRYAVDVLQHAYTAQRGLAGAGFSLCALLLIGITSSAVGVSYFRWDATRVSRTSARVVAIAALSAWIAVGVAATMTGRLQPVFAWQSSYTAVTEEQIQRISYDDLPGDNELVTRLAPPFKTDAERARMADFVQQLKNWPPGNVSDPAQATRNLLSLTGIADITADLREAEIARAVFDELQARYSRNELKQILAWIVLAPDAGTVVTNEPTFGFRKTVHETYVRERCGWYAKKFLGRLVGKISEPG
jgi:ABC-2 type transport system permease protein